jgi:glycosyltransferase involved in cell wall biosynthesis
MEALASGLPVVACNSGAAAEIIIDTQTGVLVPPNDPQGIKEGVKRILNDPLTTQKMSQAGRLLVEEQYNSHALDKELEALVKGGI